MTAQGMDSTASWDFRETQELLMSSIYEKDGYIIADADQHYLDLLKSDLQKLT